MESFTMYLASWDQILMVVLLGIIEGITEFLPISSTGHLLIAQHWLGPQSDAFTVIIQSGAILAVVLIYWQRLIDLVLNCTKPGQRSYLLKIFFSFFITGVGGLLLKKLGWELPETIIPIVVALVVGAILFMIVDKPGQDAGSAESEPSWSIAFWMGIAQIAAAVFPGLSRSGATIIMALFLGMRRRGATEYSFILSIPTMFAAGGLEGWEAWQEGQFTQDALLQLAVGFVVSMIVAFISVKWLLKYVQTHTFQAFAWYRIILAGALCLFLFL